MAIDLRGELDLGVVEVIEPHVGPSQGAQLGHARAGERRRDDRM